MKKFGAALLAAGLLVGVGACSSDPVSGVVVSKDYDAASEKKKCSKTNGKRKCRTVKDSADYELTVKADDGKTQEVDVSKSVYDSVQVGQRYTQD
jgi:hypothetical protein